MTALDVLWADASLDALSVDYDSVRIDATETTGRKVRITCEGHIGLSYEGFWDETIIESGTVVEAHPFGERCLQGIGSAQAADTGSPARNGRQFQTLVLTLIDGIDVLCCAARFDVRDCEPNQQ